MAAHNTPPRVKGAVRAPHIKVALVMLLIMFTCSILSLQAFLYQYVGIGRLIGAGENASFMTTLPPIFMGVSAFVYASLADFVSIRKIFVTGFCIFIAASCFGCIAGYAAPMEAKLATVVIARCVQAFGGQISGSCFLVLAGRYLEGKERVVFYGIFTAVYQLGAGLGALASGFLATPHIWPLLFILPCVAIFTFWPCYKNMPELVQGAEGVKGHVDVFGFCVFTIFSGFLIAFISFPSAPILLFVSLLALVCFIVWIAKAKAPFITPSFFSNLKWLFSAASLFILWITAYGVLPLVRQTAEHVFSGVDDAGMAVWLLLPISVAILMGVLSGSITERCGRTKTIVLAVLMQLVGFVGGACVLSSMNLLWFMCFLSSYWGGYALVYSPLVDTIISTVRSQEIGRGFGMNDLILALAPSIGMAFFSPFIQGQETLSIIEVATPAISQYASLLLLYTVFAVCGLLCYLFARTYITKHSRKEQK